MASNIACDQAYGVRPSRPIRERKPFDSSDPLARPWSELPDELLEIIASYLGLIELISFRAVCQDWRFASWKATAEIGSSKPWFLAIIDKSDCLLVDESNKRYNVTIPELCEATCIGSNYGWLLLLKESSTFFFCPFSRAKIELPQLPCSETFEPVAAFSSAPTCKDCIVCVISNSVDAGNSVEIHTLQRGASSWTTHKFNGDRTRTFNGAFYQDYSFYFFYGVDFVVKFSVGDKKSTLFKVVKPTSNGPKLPVLPCALMTDSCKVGIESQFENASISTCGTVLVRDSQKYVICNQKINTDANRKMKAVWTHPRFFELSPEQSCW
ncbi:hypothetical protein ACFE04_017955 [Oxalis oulophora]